jgi:hypothetical protein
LGRQKLSTWLSMAYTSGMTTSECFGKVTYIVKIVVNDTRR